MTRSVFRSDDPAVNPYKLLTALVVPRPIAWVSTVDTAGIGNLAPHSFFTVASAHPPIVQFTSVGVKDTLRNVLATGEFVINLASRANLNEINATSARFEVGVDEAHSLGIAMESSEFVRPARVAGSPASIECRLHSTVDLGESTLVLGDVVACTVEESALEGQQPVFERLQPLSRLGGSAWGWPPDAFDLERPGDPADVLEQNERFRR